MNVRLTDGVTVDTNQLALLLAAVGAGLWSIGLVTVASVVVLAGVVLVAADEVFEVDRIETDSSASTPSLDTLKRRYANGEIDETEFERRVEQLLGTDHRAEDADLSVGSKSEQTRTREPE